MVYALLPRSTFLRAVVTPTLGPRTFTRQKSITQAIEAGKRRASSPASKRFSGPSRYPRSYQGPNAEEAAPLPPNRAARRREDFGTTPAYEKMVGRLEAGSFGSAERVEGDAGYGAGTRQRRGASSRFGRVGPARGRDEDMPSRREEGGEREAGFRKTDGGGVGEGEGEGRPDYNAGPRTEGEQQGTEKRYSNRNSDGKAGADGAKVVYERRPYGDKRREWGQAEESSRPSFARRDYGPGVDGAERVARPRHTDGGEGYADRRPYTPRDYEGGDRASERQPYRGNRYEAGARDQGRRQYGSRRTGGGDRELDRRPYDRNGAHGGERGSDRRPYDRDGTHGGERGPDRRANGATREAGRSFQSGPESLPYTTAASEFIYGHSSVLAAIKANRRKLYKLYVHSQRGGRDGFMAKVRAHKLFEITNEVGDEYLRAMDKASTGRPHNGVVLEASPLPVPPVVALRTPSMADEIFEVVLDTQSVEDALVNGKNELFSYKSAGWRHPLVLYVDGVLDEGNLGAMARSAYFLGVDAIITSTNHVAPWSHIALKASAGAAEAIPIFKVGKPNDFLTKSSQAGWKIYASNAVPPAPPSTESPTAETPETETNKIVYTFPKSSRRVDGDHCPVAEHPTILMMGAEATGLKHGLSNLAHYNVGIPHGRDANEVGVDSLNVSAAASVLCYEMLQRPKKKKPDRNPEDLLF
ncbi:hypothetical protein J1614_009920 [Plenodomus biglobosus]|nr:hypothetical protein J1614_009920 [Plenodomus biglobosus]